VLLVDKEAVEALRRKTLEDFLLECVAVSREDSTLVDILIGHFQFNWESIEDWCKENHGSAPALVSITATKEHTRPRLFVDYFNIRQCTKNDFFTDRLVEAIATIGVTLVELGADFRAESALLRSACSACWSCSRPPRRRGSCWCVGRRWAMRRR
jgi:hypothetical protein